jgi:hypothetical protein
MKRFIIILLAVFAVVFGAATTAEAGGDGSRTYYRSYGGPTYYRSYSAPRYSYGTYGYCTPRYYGGSYGYCAPRYYGGSYGYCAPRYYYPHGGITIAVPGFGFHMCR